MSNDLMTSKLDELQKVIERLQKEVDLKTQTISDLESELKETRTLLDEQRKEANLALYEKDVLEQKIREIEMIITIEENSSSKSDQ